MGDIEIRDCPRCLSAGSIEFGLCQICLAQWPGDEPVGHVPGARIIDLRRQDDIERADLLPVRGRPVPKPESTDKTGLIAFLVT